MQKFIAKHSIKVAGVCLIGVGLIEFFGGESQTLGVLGKLLWGVAALAWVTDLVARRRGWEP